MVRRQLGYKTPTKFVTWVSGLWISAIACVVDSIFALKNSHLYSMHVLNQKTLAEKKFLTL